MQTASGHGAANEILQYFGMIFSHDFSLTHPCQVCDAWQSYSYELNLFNGRRGLQPRKAISLGVGNRSARGKCFALSASSCSCSWPKRWPRLSLGQSRGRGTCSTDDWVVLWSCPGSVLNFLKQQSSLTGALSHTQRKNLLDKSTNTSRTVEQDDKVLYKKKKTAVTVSNISVRISFLFSRSNPLKPQWQQPWSESTLVFTQQRSFRCFYFLTIMMTFSGGDLRC